MAQHSFIRATTVGLPHLRWIVEAGTFIVLVLLLLQYSNLYLLSNYLQTVYKLEARGLESLLPGAASKSCKENVTSDDEST